MYFFIMKTKVTIVWYNSGEIDKQISLSYFIIIIIIV